MIKNYLIFILQYFSNKNPTLGEKAFVILCVLIFASNDQASAKSQFCKTLRAFQLPRLCPCCSSLHASLRQPNHTSLNSVHLTCLISITSSSPRAPDLPPCPQHQGPAHNRHSTKKEVKKTPFPLTPVQGFVFLTQMGHPLGQSLHLFLPNINFPANPVVYSTAPNTQQVHNCCVTNCGREIKQLSPTSFLFLLFYPRKKQFHCEDKIGQIDSLPSPLHPVVWRDTLSCPGLSEPCSAFWKCQR